MKRADERTSGRADATASALVHAFIFVICLALPVRAQSVAITNAKIYPISGAVIERGTVVIRNGKIAAVGASVTVPSDARVIDAAGKIVTPGFMDSQTGLGMVEIGAAAGTN